MKKRDDPQSELEQIILQNGSAELLLGGGASAQRITTEAFLSRIQSFSARGLYAEALPDNVKWRVDCGPATVFIAELKPEVRSILWIDPKSPVPYGPAAIYQQYRLATPYVVLKAAFLNGRLLPTCELFYRNQPLRSADDELYWSNLLNVSPNSYGCIAWLCTQYLEKELKGKLRGMARGESMADQLDNLAKHAWGGGFNLSSEAHEGKSCFQKFLEDKIDKRAADVDHWRAESEKDASFILTVNWKSTGVTVRQLIERQLAAARVVRNLADTAELISVLLGQAGGG